MKVTKIGVHECIDATEDLVITVTPNDVNNANTKAPGNCAVARACKRQEKLISRVHITRIYLHNGEKYWKRYITPANLRTEIIAFDRGGDFIPRTYTLKAPTGTKRLGKSNQKSGKHRKNAKKRMPYIKTLDIRTGPANGV